MDLQGTKEARAQEEGTERPLDAYGGGSGRSKKYHKNEGRDSHNHDNSTNVHPLRRRQPPFTYPHGARPSNAQSSNAAPRPRKPSPSPEAISIPQALGLSLRDKRLLCRARLHPPVTKKTLSELDLPCIMSNINLRMNINFDCDLHFKSDLDGEKGRRKRKEAADYWDSMATEIAIYAFWAAPPDDRREEQGDQESSPRTFEPRLPAMFETLQKVIKTLVPVQDHPSVMQNLEVSLLVQQVRKGVLDMVALATWIAALLKTYCAPMRDEWADKMVEQITDGSQSQEPKEIVNGLQTLFALLEAMKLDVANHQIRAFRVLLIEDTVPFLQEYFDGKIKRGNIQIESARLWYKTAREKSREEDARKDPSSLADENIRPLEALFRGITDQLLQFTPPDEFPETLLFDSDRIWQLRSTVQNLLNLETAWYIFESWVHSQKSCFSARDETYSTFRTRIWSLMEDGVDLDSRPGRNPDNDPNLRGGVHWNQNMRCIALEIARFACAACCLRVVVADEVIDPIEQALEWHLSNDSELFRYFQAAMREKVLTTTLDYARKYLPLSPLAICESQCIPAPSSTGPAPVFTTSIPGPSFTPQQYDIERIGMRLAHMGILHWRVWAPILYLREEIAETVLPAFV